MKVMNEIQSDFSGVIVETLIEDGMRLSTTLFKIRPLGLSNDSQNSDRQLARLSPYCPCLQRVRNPKQLYIFHYRRTIHTCTIADEAICIGPAQGPESYLRADLILCC